MKSVNPNERKKKMDLNKPIDLNAHDMAMPRAEEIQYIHNFTESFLQQIDRNPEAAKKIVHEVLRPYMAAQLRTLALLEHQIEGYEDQNNLLLRSNGQLIHNCKVKGVSLPNFDEIQRDYYAEKTMKEQLEKGAGIKL